MAEESTTKKNTFEDMMFTLFFLFVVAQMVARIPVLIEEKTGIDIGGSQAGLAAATVDADTPLGSQVVVPNGASFSGAPGASASGTFLPGQSLVLSDGPRTVGFDTWWYVEDPETGEGGWVKEADLIQQDKGGLGIGTSLGTRVRSILDTQLWESAGGEIAAGVLGRDDTGTIDDGPATVRGSRWWFVDTDDSRVDGWVPESVLTRSASSDLKRGLAVKAITSADLFERAGGGRVLGFFAEDEQGTIEDGPEEVGGSFWWFVETSRGESGWVAESALAVGGARGIWKSFVFSIVIVGGLITVVLLVGLVYVTLRTNQIRAREARRIRDAIPKSIAPLKNERWERVTENVHSENPNDWRLAIIEADVMLDELITGMGYYGGTLGEKLKTIAHGDMRSLESAWEAHKVRNQIAHAGSDFILTQREARRVIDLYEQVFTEFKYI
jgi:hypothetical protein